MCTAVVQPLTKKQAWRRPPAAGQQAWFGGTDVPHLLLLLSGDWGQGAGSEPFWGDPGVDTSSRLSGSLSCLSPNPVSSSEGRAWRAGALPRDACLKSDFY